MILYKENPISLVKQNCFGLEVEDSDAVIYVSRGVYDQAIILSDRHSGEISLIKKKLGVDESKVIDFYYEHAPEPLNMLAPFLGAVEANDIELHEDLRELTGVLHQLSTFINFDYYLRAPESVRAELTLTKRMALGFEDSWNDLEETIKLNDIDASELPAGLLNYIIEEIKPAFANATPVYVTQATTAATEEDEEAEEEDIWALFDKEMSELAEEREAEAAEAQTESTPVPAPAPAPATASTSTGSLVEQLDAEAPPNAEEELDKLLQLMGKPIKGV